MRKLYLFFCFLSMAATFSAHAQTPVVEWQKRYETYFEYATLFDVRRTADSGYITAGYMANEQYWMPNARVMGSAMIVGYMVKTDANGTQQWQYMPVLPGYTFFSVTQAADGTYIGAGHTEDLDYSGQPGNLYLEKINNNASRRWYKMLGGSGDDRAYSIQTTPDGNYIMAGTTSSNDLQVSGNHGSQDAWVVKTDTAGIILWQKCLGGTGSDTAYAIINMTDGYLVAGSTTSNNGQVTANYGGTDAWLVKLDLSGNLVWQKTYGGTGYDMFKKLQLTSDGGIIAVGATYSNDGVVSGNHGNADVWIVKTDATGNLAWQHCYGGSSEDKGTDIKEITGDGYVVNSYTRSTDGNITLNHGGADQWVFKVNTNGSMLWDKSLGRNRDDQSGAMVVVNDHDYVVLGNIDSSYVRQGNLTKLSWLNEIVGTIYVDVNANGIRDVGEVTYNEALVKSVRADGYSKTSQPVNGYSSNLVDVGTYQTSVLLNSSYYTVYPASYTSTFADYNKKDTVVFRMEANASINDLQVSVFPLGVMRPGFTATYIISYKNVGTTLLSGVTIDFKNDGRCAFVSTNPVTTSVSGNIAHWDIGALQPTTQGEIVVNLQSQAPPATNINDTLKFYVTGGPLAGDQTPANNADTLFQVVRGSFDPNDKTEAHGGVITPAQAAAGDRLTYTIRFQNTGTDTAFTVTVRDTLESRLDWNSLQMISASHPYQLSIDNGNKLTWQFNNINLPYTAIDEPNSHGYITYSIKPLATVTVGDTIKNTAGIYFDYNLPVATNAEKTIVMAVNVSLPVELVSFSAAQAGSLVNITWTTSLEKNVSVYEVERSANGVDFTTIGTVSATGSTTYLFKDNQPLTGYNYYRLKPVDVNGSYKHSTIAMVNIGSGADVLSSIYPNPGNGNITLLLQGAIGGRVTVQVLDEQGRIITSRDLGVQQSGQLKTSLQLGGLSKGSYLLRINAANKVYFNKLLIQ